MTSCTGVRPFELGELPALSRSTVDRDEALRSDPEALAARWPDSRVVLVDKLGRSPVKPGGGSLAWRPAAEFGDDPVPAAVLLGEQDGVLYWAVPDTREPDAPASDAAHRAWHGPSYVDGEEWNDLRGVGALLDDTSAGLLTTAVALLHWHRRARYCARCGSTTSPVYAGWAARCSGCGRDEFPRTDPAVICLVHDDSGVNGEHVLLARQPSWPRGRYSVLAGFVEAGESLEACVVREVAEEVGVRVSGVRYLGSQPWPFPRSLMLGFAARAAESDKIVLTDGEIAEARWFSRAEVAEAIRAGGRSDTLGLPFGSSIARVMLESWAGAAPATS